MSSEEGDDAVGALAEWVTGAPQEQRDAHYRAQRWAHVLGWQVGRLQEARRQALESFEEVPSASGVYPDTARWPFMEMDAEAHFTLVAARQLIRALRAFDGQDRLPDNLSNSTLRDLRDALEHWDAPGGSEAAKRLQTRGLDPFAHTWSRGGAGVLGQIVSDAVLQQWANDVYEILSQWDPYDGWAT